MCGIVALLQTSPIDRLRLTEMRDRLAHRGPDGAGIWISEDSACHVGLAHRRLSIIDLGDGGHQPMLSEDGRCAIVFNGEIYNYIELRAELEMHGHRFRSNCDTEVLLTAYRAWGTDCLSRLNGMFAFALWDADKRELFVARDRFGEKPLYMTRLPGNGWALASEMKALLADPEVSDELDRDFLSRFLEGAMPFENERTPFATITRLQPATALRINAAGDLVACWRHWTPRFEPILTGVPVQDLADRFAELLDRSLQLRLRSDVGVAACLSGGLDSSLLVSMAHRLGPTTFTGDTFSARFDDVPAISEGPYIDMVNRRFGLTGHAVTPNADDLAEDCARLHWHQEIPFSSSSMFLEWCVMRLTRQNGIKVLINGQGPDELLGGYHHYFAHHQFDLIKRGHFATLLFDTLAMSLRLAAVRLRFGGSENRVPVGGFAGMARALQQGLRGADPDLPCRDGVPSSRGGNTLRHLIADGALYSILPEQLHSADANSMAFGIEARCPFLDNDLVAFCFQLPEDSLFHNGWQKYIMRRAGAPLLPREVCWRADKIGFAGPQNAWLSRDLPEWVETCLSDSVIEDTLGIRPEAAKRDWASLRNGVNNQSWRVWRWISLTHWLRLHRSNRWRNGWPEDTSVAYLEPGQTPAGKVQ